MDEAVLLLACWSSGLFEHFVSSALPDLPCFSPAGRRCLVISQLHEPIYKHKAAVEGLKPSNVIM